MHHHIQHDKRTKAEVRKNGEATTRLLSPTYEMKANDYEVTLYRAERKINQNQQKGHDVEQYIQA